MLKFKRTTIRLNGVATKAYSVKGLDRNVFRGLRVAVVKRSADRWYAYEATTGLSITPSSWKGGLSNKTRKGIIHIVSIFLSNASESGWGHIQDQLDYALEMNS